MKAESMQLSMILITQNYQGVPFAPNRGDSSYISVFNFYSRLFDRRGVWTAIPTLKGIVLVLDS